MSLFQNSVLNKYLKALEYEKVTQAYERFTSHFHNPVIQENIRNSKEEQYQGEFLIDLFVHVLGYIKNPTPDFNLTTELKNIKDSKKTDGAILSKDHDHLGNVIAVIELKGTSTTDLSKVETQAFGYKNNQPGCNYVITSNFEKLRFYIDNAVDYEEFNLFQLSRDRFDILWLCLSSEYLLKDIPKKIKDESLTQEENVTKKLYKDYASFRNEIFDAIQKENPEYDKLTLFKKTQKLLDRFLFIFFAEDRLLLPPNSIRSIVNQWTDLRDKYDEYFPLYDRFKKYFGYMNTGHKGHQHDIFAYNGGLFAPDEILDNIKINDELLHKHTVNLSNYDFESEVSVNILGHIFEHSLNDIDQIQAEIQGTTMGNDSLKNSKRKKDGVFYTPKYITKYIVDNTVGKLCEEKKSELDIQETEYEKERKGRQQATLKKLTQKLEDYRKWLLELTICDPACGSGAFLNQALEFLIAEHQYIDELQAKLFGDSMVLSEVENSILENNLFGVDINEESVEIAKLSLWLRTAQKGRKLTSLNDNIKCGNSLIDDPAVAGDKAFHWQTEFPEVFKSIDKQAFHVVLTTRNSRTSQRMMDYKVEKGEPIELSLEEELALTEIMGEIIRDNGYHCLAYNVCKDHVHLILVCEAEELTDIVQKLKSMSSKQFRRLNIPLGHDPLEQKGFWSQKFFRADLDVWKLATLDHRPGYLYKDAYIDNAIHYVKHNREKHQLPESKKLTKLIESFIEDQDTAFATEYKGGFDVVIGNPPYVRQELFKEIKPYLQEHYQCYNSVADLYTYFIEKGISLMSKDGLFSYILPNKFMRAKYGKQIREVILNECHIEFIIDFDDYTVFEDATTYPIIYVFSKQERDYFYFSKINKRTNTVDPINTLERNKIQVLKSSISFKPWTFNDSRTFKVLKKIESESYPLKEIVDNKIFRGVSTGCNDVFIIDEEQAVKFGDCAVVKKIFTGKEVKRYNAKFQGLYLLFLTWDYDIDSNNAIKEYLLENKERLNSRPEVQEGRFNWWCLSRYGSKNSHLLTEPKIIYPRINNECNFFLDTSGEYSLSDNNFYISSGRKDLLSILNSKLIFFFLKNNCSTLQGGYYDFRRPYIEKIPINKNLGSENKELEFLSLRAINCYSHFENIKGLFIELLKSKFSITKPSKKLQNWHELDFGEFLKELEKARKKSVKNASKEHAPLNYTKLSLSEEAEWMQYFNEQKEKAEKLKAEIDKTDKEIDAMVYQLYGLTDEEIQIVEESTK